MWLTAWMTPFLAPCSVCKLQTRQIEGRCITHKVCLYDFAVEVDPDAEQTDFGPQTLRLAAEELLVQGGWNGLGAQNPTAGVGVQADVVPQHGLDELLAGLLVAMIGQMGEGRVDGHKQRVVGLGAVKQLYDVVVLVHQLGEVSCVLTL
jgi:hypothetical protein